MKMSRSENKTLICSGCILRRFKCLIQILMLTPTVVKCHKFSSTAILNLGLLRTLFCHLTTYPSTRPYPLLKPSLKSVQFVEKLFKMFRRHRNFEELFIWVFKMIQIFHSLIQIFAQMVLFIHTQLCNGKIEGIWSKVDLHDFLRQLEHFLNHIENQVQYQNRNQLAIEKWPFRFVSMFCSTFGKHRYS